MTIKTVKQESKLEEFTASFLLSEFRKDMREVHRDMGQINKKIDNKFVVMLSIQFGTFATLIGTVLTLLLKTKGV